MMPDSTIVYYCITATGASDYADISMSVLFPAGVFFEIMCVNVTILEDSLVEGEESFTLVLNSSDSAVDLSNTFISTELFITIRDNDGTVLTIFTVI